MYSVMVIIRPSKNGFETTESCKKTAQPPSPFLYHPYNPVEICSIHIRSGGAARGGLFFVLEKVDQLHRLHLKAHILYSVLSISCPSLFLFFSFLLCTGHKKNRSCFLNK